MYSDKELVDKILEGNRNAFALLVKKYERLVFHIVNRVVSDDEATKDLSQDVFIKVYLKLEDFKFDAKLSTWIATIAYRNALNYLKKTKNESISHAEDPATCNVAADASPHKELETKDIQQYVHKLIDKLPVQYKTVLTLYHLNEFNYKEIYEITGWPEGTVKNYLFRARNLLKESMKKKLGKVDVLRY